MSSALSAAAARPAMPGAGLAELERGEAALEAEWARLQQAGHGYAGVRAALLEEPDPGARERRLRDAARAQEAFLARLDEFQRRLHVHFMDQVLRELDHAADTMARFYGKGGVRRIHRAHARIVRLARQYRALEPLYGTPRDHLRIQVYQRFYAAVVAFSRRIRRLDPTMPEPRPRGLVELATGMQRAIAWRVLRIPDVLQCLWAGLLLLKTLFSRPGSSDQTPISRRIDAFFRAWGKVQGYRVEVSGRELASAACPPGTVTLYTPAHRHGGTDNITMAHLELPDYCVFNATDQLPLPRFLRDRAAATPGLIPVGGQRGPSIDRALEALRSGVSRNVLIYPEGSVSEGFRGTRPPRRKFGDGLVRRIRQAGFDVRLVPITYLDNARFLDLPPVSALPEERRLRVVVSPALEPEMVDAVLDVAGGDALGRLLRCAWLEQLVTDDRLFLGHDRVRAVEARLDLELDGVRYWGSLESAPVRDRLETKSEEPLIVREEPFRGMRVRVLRFPDSAREPDGQIVLRNLQDPESRELLIGIRPPSHIYLHVGSRRFDGDIFRPLRVRERVAIRPGIVVRFVGVPKKSVHCILRELEALAGREYRTLTCANSACQLIARAANLEIDDHADMRPFLPSHVLPTRTLRKLIERGVRNHLGERVEVQIYKTDDRSLEEILHEARREEIRIVRDHLALLTAGAWRSLRRGIGSLRTRRAKRR